ncbi:YfcC family protein [Ureibacillus sp. NPDC094379]
MVQLDSKQTSTDIPEHSHPSKNKKPRIKGINSFALMFGIMIVMTILTYVIPAGQYERLEVGGRTVVDPTSFTFIESSSVGFFDIFTSIHQGLVLGAPIILFVILFGGALGIMQKTGTIDAFIQALAIKFRHHPFIVIPILVLVFASLGALIGSAEDTLVYIAIVIPLMLVLRFDAITGFAIVMLGTLATGFTAGITNPFNVGVAQTISELPMYSGMSLRIALFTVMYVFTVFYIIRHANKVQKNPELGVYGKFNPNETINLDISVKMSMRHLLSLVVLLGSFALLIFGVIKLGWYISEICAVFLLASIIMSIICRSTIDEMTNGFINGSKEMIEGAMIIGFAQAILVIATNGNLIDTILYYVSSILGNIPASVNAVGMLFLQMVMNFIVPSGSGQAALTMPILAPLADLIGVTRQTTVLAFQLGDGISNLVMPTSGILLAGLSISGISYTKWIKWVIPYLGFLTLIAIVFIIIAQVIQYGPF